MQLRSLSVMAAFGLSMVAFAPAGSDPDTGSGSYRLVPGSLFLESRFGDSVINLTNTGPLTLPTGLTTTGNICVNVYTFDANEELISCCSCLVTPNGLELPFGQADLVSNTLTPGVPTSIVIKLLATTPLGLSPAARAGSATPRRHRYPGGSWRFRQPGPGMRAWGTTFMPCPPRRSPTGLPSSRSCLPLSARLS